MKYITPRYVSGCQHWLIIAGFHVVLGSLQRTKIMIEMRTCSVSIVTTINQRNLWIKRCAARRIRLMEKDVLPRAHDMMTKGCDT